MVTGLRRSARCHSPGRIRKRRDSPGEFDDTSRSAGSEIAFHVPSANPPPQRSVDDELAPLLQRIRERDQAALGELYDRTSSQVYATALNMLRDPDDAEEVVGDIYQQVWEKADSYDPSRGRVIAWLLTQAWTRAIDRLRRDRKHARTLHFDAADMALVQDETMTSARLIDALDAETAVAKAFDQLSVPQREMVALAFYEDLSHPEIAERTGVAIGTVKSHIRRGLAALRKVLDVKEPRRG